MTTCLAEQRTQRTLPQHILHQPAQLAKQHTPATAHLSGQHTKQHTPATAHLFGQHTKQQRTLQLLALVIIRQSMLQAHTRPTVLASVPKNASQPSHIIIQHIVSTCTTPSTVHVLNDTYRSTHFIAMGQWASRISTGIDGLCCKSLHGQCVKWPGIA
jgi:hypothetical protein